MDKIKKDRYSQDDKWKKEIADIIKKHGLLPNQYTGQVTLIFYAGRIRNALRGPKPLPINKN